MDRALITQRVKRAIVVAQRTFSRLFHWFRLPGFISWIAVSLGTMAAFLVPFRVLPIQDAPHSASIFWTAVSLAALLAAAGIVLRRRFARFSAFFLFALLACMLRREYQYEAFGSLRETTAAGGSITFAGRVTSAPMPYFENFHFLLKIDSTAGDGLKKWRGLTVNCICPFEPPQYGRVIVRGAFAPPEAKRNPYEYDDFKAKMASGVWGTLTAATCRVVTVRLSPLERLSIAFRATAASALRKVKNFDNRALLQAMFLGDTEFLSPFIKDTFRKSGLYHLISISGLNTAMLVSALYFLLRLFPLGRTAPHLICIAALWGYLLFVGTIPSLFRATVMATLVIAAFLFEKKTYAMQILGLAGTIWLALSPESLFGPGYQLSFAATAGLLTLFPVLSRFTPRFTNSALKGATAFLFSSLYISIASFLATAPVLLYHFGTVSYFGLVANLVAVGAMTVSMWAFFAGLLFQTIVPFFATFPLWVSERFLDIVVYTGSLAGHVSWSQMTYAAPSPATILLFSLFLFGIVVVDRARLGRYCLFAGAVIALLAPLGYALHRSGGTLTAVRFAVPQTPCIGIRWPDGRVWLVIGKGGPSLPRRIERRVIPWTRHAGNRVETIVVPDDAVSGAEACRETLPAFAKARVATFPSVGRGVKKRAGVDIDDDDIAPPDSLLSRLTHRDGYTCRIFRQGASIRVAIASPRADTALALDAGASPASALVVTMQGKNIHTREEVPEDHPVR